MNPKQDRPAARTPEDLERKYNFGENFHEIKQTIQQQNIAMEKQSQLFSNYVGTNDKALQNLVENYGKLREKVSTLENNLKTVDSKIGSTVESLCKAEAGFIKIFGGGKVPDGFLLCNGSSYSRTAYPELFAAIGITFGAGDGSTTFNVPNLATRVPVGKGTGYALGATGGEATHILTVNEMPSHSHNLSDPVVAPGASGGGVAGMEWNTDSHNWGTRYAVATGGSQPHNNMQPYTVVNYIIATGKTFVNTSTT